jgi:hypothetical protein
MIYDVTAQNSFSGTKVNHKKYYYKLVEIFESNSWVTQFIWEKPENGITILGSLIENHVDENIKHQCRLSSTHKDAYLN